MRSMNHAKSSSSSSSSSSSPAPPLSLALTSITYDNCTYVGASNPAAGKALLKDAVEWQHHHHHHCITPSLPLSQSTGSGPLDLRFSWSGADMEPWRCRRTDGKKWRCSRDVAPNQKYCDRHTHKNRPRSRKPVEVSSQQQQALKPSQIHSNISNPTNNPHNQSRFLWPVSQQQPSHVSPRLESKETGNLGDIFLCPPQHYYKNEQAVGLQKFENDPCHHYHDAISSASSLCSKTTSMDGIATTKMNKGLQPVSSLTLSMPDENGIDHVDNNINENDYKLELGMNYPWMISQSTPGGPLGEALGLRNASVTRGG